MANKKTFLLFTTVDADALLKSEAPELIKIIQKGTVVPLTVNSDIEREAGSGSTDGQMIWDAAKDTGLVVESIKENGTDFAVDHASDQQEVCKKLEEALSLGIRKMLIVVVCPNKAIFYGLGIERGKVLEKSIAAASIAPTIALLGDLPFPANIEAPIAYGVIKGLDFKMREVRKLVETNESMMEAMERPNRKPWDKHDCA